MNAPFPENETDRLEALKRYAILDTKPEQAFDDLVELAAQVCQTPIALVTFIDPLRQWFKAKVGLTACETSRNIAFCSHTIMQRGIFEVRDALDDPRFVANPLVVENPFIRFYAGIPLVTPDGYALGTLCVIDRVPRELTADQRQALAALGRQIMSVLELSRRQIQLERAMVERPRLTQDKLSFAIDQSIDGTALLDREGRYTYINPAHAAMYGYTPGELIGQPWTVLYTAEWQNAIHESYFPILLNRGYWRGELIGKKKSGDPVSVEVSLALLPSDGLDGDWLLCTCQDITAHKQAERAVKASEERLNLAVSAGHVGIFEHNHQDGTLYWSPILRSIYGVSPDESGSLERYLSLVHHTDRDRVLAAICQAHNPTGDGEFHIEHKVVRPDGHIRHMSLHSRTCFTDEGTTRVPTRTTGTVLDITERKQAEAKIHAAAVEIKGVLTAVNAVQATAEFNLDGTIITANDNFLRMMGYGLHEVQGRHHRMFCDPADTNHSAYAAFWQKLVRGEFDAGVYKRIGKNGKEAWIQASYNPVFDAHGKVYKIVKFATDITDRKTAEARLEQYAQEVANQNVELELVNEKALVASRAKSEFLATMSHEIRTPMNAIVAMADLLQETTLSRDQQEYVGRFSRAATNLLDLINNILDLSKIEAGHLELESVPFDLHDLLEKTAELMVVRAHAKELELVISVHPDVPVFVTGDPTRLRQVLMNLVGNAIKFTERGEVVIHLVPDETQPGNIRCSVTDTGVGIRENKLVDIFDTFTQVDSSTTRQYGGTGLGLSISKRIVELMGGSIAVESQPGTGSTFSFVVPLPATEERGTARTLPTVDIRHRCILVVEDNHTNRQAIREHLSQLDAMSIEAESGAAALMALERAQHEGRTIDLAIVDDHMPDMNGQDLVKTIRQQPHYATLPLVMQISNMHDDSSRTTNTPGIRSFVYKPISRRRLLESLVVALNQEKTVSPSVNHQRTLAKSPGLRPFRILLVEDLEDNRDIMHLYLRETPYRIEMAENGQVAVEKFQSRSYDLVFMDMQMPVMDGLQATMAMRQWEREHQRRPTPIVALTANAFKEEADKSLAAGCTGHVTKPIRKKTLLRTIGQYASALTDQAV